MEHKQDLEEIMHFEHIQRYIGTMRPVFNRRALFSDTTEEYLSPSEPEAYDKVTIRFRTAKNNVDWVRLICRGEKVMMRKVETKGSFDYYACELQLKGEKLTYYFEIRSGRFIGYYDTRGLVQEANEYYNLVILTGFKTPAWAKGAVMYQI